MYKIFDEYPWAKGGMKVRCVKARLRIYEEGRVYELESTKWGLVIRDEEGTWNGYDADWEPVSEFTLDMVEEIL